MKERKKEKKRTLNMIFSTIITNTFKMGGFDGRTEQNGEGKRRRETRNFCLFNFQKLEKTKMDGIKQPETDWCIKLQSTAHIRLPNTMKTTPTKPSPTTAFPTTITTTTKTFFFFLNSKFFTSPKPAPLALF